MPKYGKVYWTKLASQWQNHKIWWDDLEPALYKLYWIYILKSKQSDGVKDLKYQNRSVIKHNLRGAVSQLSNKLCKKITFKLIDFVNMSVKSLYFY